MCSTNSSPSTVYPSPELSDLDLDLDDDYSYGFQSLRRRPSLALEHNRAKRLRRSPSLSPAPAHSFSDDSDDLTVVNDTTTDVAVSSSPSVVTSGLLHHSILDSPPYQPADVFPDSSIDWHEQVVEYDWASSTDEDERKTIISDCSYWSGIDCRDESLSDLEARFGIDSPPYHPQDYNELDPAMDPQEARWFEQQLTTIISGSHRRQSDSPPYIPFDYNTLNSAMDPNEDRYFEQPRVNYTCAVAATVSSTCTDSESHEGYTSSNEISLSDDDDC
ncbi:hypothetical protein EC991_003293 [Linnemannia zychae]|nr:hypothetical protein EC991_003293 [Linnemannia zychae]